MTIHHDQPLDLGDLQTPQSTPGASRGRRVTVRRALVARVRLQIAAGQYLTAERWDATLDRVARALGA